MPGVDVTLVDTLDDGAASPTTESTMEHLPGMCPPARDHDGNNPLPADERNHDGYSGDDAFWRPHNEQSHNTMVEVKNYITNDKTFVTNTNTVNTITTDEETNALSPNAC